MSQTNTKETSPLQNLFVDVKKIIDFMVVKDLAAANAAETEETKYLSQGWMDAIMKRDTYRTYRKLWTRAMFQEVVNSVSQKEFEFYAMNPDRVPLKFRETLRELGRESFLSLYIEKNNYYRMLLGVPDYEDYDWIYLSEELQEKYGVDSKTPVHLMDTSIQRRYMFTQEYRDVVAANPNKKYLQYMGIYKVDLYTARNAKDFEIIRYPANRSDINPNILAKFSELYDKYREYVMVVLYNTQFEGVYEYYRTFMGALILEYTLFQLGNASLEAVNDRKYLDDTILHTALSMYGIPDSLLMNKNARRDLAIHILKLVKEKGTNEVYYDLANILGYQDVAISKLMLMKGQQFDSNGKVIYDENGKPKVEPYFLQVDLKDTDPYTTITNGKARRYSYEEIINGDPTWWNDDKVQQMLKESNYSMTDSKYITISAMIHQMEYMFESIYFSKMILDNPDPVQDFEIEIPELFGTERVSVYDIVLFMISAMSLQTGTDGAFITDTDLKIIAGFNFDLNMNTFLEYLFSTKYVDIDRLMSFINSLTITSIDDISRVFYDVISPMREWLERKIVQAEDRQEYLEYENVYRALFSYDIAKATHVGDNAFKTPMETICEEYGITEDQMAVYRHFYPRTLTGEVITVSNLYKDGRYQECYEFIDNEINWYLKIPELFANKGYLYLHDILNCHDCRDIPVRNENGTDTGLKFFMEYKDDSGWQINTKAVELAIKAIESLDGNQLNNAKIFVSTPNIEGSETIWYSPGTPLVKIAPVFKNILIEKLQMDIDGLADPATTYFELLRRRNSKLYGLLMNDPVSDTWVNNVSTIILTLENEISCHMKYMEQAVIGKNLFFKPLVTLINLFKSMMVYIAKTGVEYIFDSKLDITGTSNMFRMFDEMEMILHFTTVSNSGFTSEFGMFDTIPATKRKAIVKDRTRLITETIGQGFATKTRTSKDGSMRMSDEAKFYKNGKPVDPNEHASVWFSGEPGSGRWSEEDDILTRTRMGNDRVQGIKYDYDAWKDYVE